MVAVVPEEGSRCAWARRAESVVICLIFRHVNSISRAEKPPRGQPQEQVLDISHDRPDNSEHSFTEIISMRLAETPSTPQRLSSLAQPLNDRAAWDRLLQRIEPTWSLGEIRARIVRRVEESDDTFSLYLRANRHWPGHRAGQNLRLQVEVDGVLRQRVFSISSAPTEARRNRRQLRLTIQRQPGQGVTEWLYQHARAGQVVTLSPPGGDFSLPDPVPPKLLMIAGGSGITPMMAMLNDLAGRGHSGDIYLLQLCRQPSRQLFAAELDALGRQLPGLAVDVHFSHSGGRLTLDSLADRVPDFDDRHTLLCGPAALMDAATAFWQTRPNRKALQTERFAAPRPKSSGTDQLAVSVTNSKQVFTQMTGQTLLESAEAAGLSPDYGCRAGICRTCLCRKTHGAVRNLITGLSSGQADEWIQLCVSVAESDLELDL